MPSYPSTKTIQQAFPSLHPEQVKLIRKLLDGTVNPCEGYPKLGHHPYNRYPLYEQKLLAISSYLQLYGVKVITKHGRPFITYVNSGDPYDVTFLFYHPTATYRTQDWGSIVEQEGAD